MYEKRVYIRVPVGIEGSFQPVTRLAAPRLGITKDLSLGGARFSSAARMEPGAEVSMALCLPKQGEVTLTGLVVWSRMSEPRLGEAGYEAGLCWKNVDVYNQARLNSFLADYTRLDEPVVVTSGPPEPSFDWTRAVSLGLWAAVLLGAAAVLWLKYHALTSDNRSLRAAVQSYQLQIGHFLSSR